MNLPEAATKILNQLADMVHQIQNSDYTQPSDILRGSTIGQHIRHILEFFMCFQAGFHKGIINYDKRPHDRILETDRTLALKMIGELVAFMAILSGNRSLKLEVGYSKEEDATVSVDTNAMREQLYNIEHAVHHMAIIRIGVREIAPYIKFDCDFGVAASTVRFNLANPISNH